MFDTFCMWCDDSDLPLCEESLVVTVFVHDYRGRCMEGRVWNFYNAAMIFAITLSYEEQSSKERVIVTVADSP
jgi:hypothetical protein